MLIPSLVSTGAWQQESVNPIRFQYARYAHSCNMECCVKKVLRSLDYGYDNFKEEQEKKLHFSQQTEVMFAC